jgi:hypothetical protein
MTGLAGGRIVFVHDPQGFFLLVSWWRLAAGFGSVLHLRALEGLDDTRTVPSGWDRDEE